MRMCSHATVLTLLDRRERLLPDGQADCLRAVDRRHHRRVGLVIDRPVELQAGRDPGRATRQGGPADRADRRRARRADRQRPQLGPDGRQLADAGQTDPRHPQGNAGRRRVRDHLGHEHARGNRLFPEPDGAIRQAGGAGGIDAAGDRDLGRRAVEPAQRRAHGDRAGIARQGQD